MNTNTGYAVWITAAEGAEETILRLEKVIGFLDSAYKQGRITARGFWVCLGHLLHAIQFRLEELGGWASLKISV